MCFHETSARSLTQEAGLKIRSCCDGKPLHPAVTPKQALPKRHSRQQTATTAAASGRLDILPHTAVAMTVLTSRSRESPDPSAATEAGVPPAVVCPASGDLAAGPGCTSWAATLLPCWSCSSVSLSSPDGSSSDRTSLLKKRHKQGRRWCQDVPR